MKKIISLIMASLMVVSVMFMLVGCAGEGGENVTENKDNNTNILDEVKSKHLCTAKIDGKDFEFPCTLKELDELGLALLYEDELQSLRTATNERFGMVLSNRTDFNLIYCMEACDDPSKGDENINVTGITTNKATKEQFSLNGDVYIGVSIDDAIASLGEDYNVVAALDPKDLCNGTVRINYVIDKERLIIDAKDGIVTYIEYGYDWSVE